MMARLLLYVLGAWGGFLALLVWRRLAGISFWVALGFPAKVVAVLLSWRVVAESCGLSRTPQRSRQCGSPAVAPRLGFPRPTRFGWMVTARMHPGQTPLDYVKAADGLAHAWRVGAVRVHPSRPGHVRLSATVNDPLKTVTAAPSRSSRRSAGELLVVSPGRLETGHPWLMNFRLVPHWLIVGCTSSGKSTLLNAIVTQLASQPVALAGFDLKGGVELAPYAPRLSVLATSRAECVSALRDVLTLIDQRMRVCRSAGVRDVWRLPDVTRPTPLVIVVDEVAELFLMSDRAEKDEVSATATALLRTAQLGRAFGVHLLVCGQRVGSDLGPGVTALRSQLSGRVCHRVNDVETALMALGDRGPDALSAAQAIPPTQPGVAVVSLDDGTWARARAVYVTSEQATQAARDHAGLAVPWQHLLNPPTPALKEAA